MRIAFIGGGNMAAALIQGLLRSGMTARELAVVEIDAPRRAQWEAMGVTALARPDASLREAATLVLAVKPQQMRAVCADLKPLIARQSIVSIAAGLRARDLARWLGTERIVRAMPNTPALIGRGITGLAALPAVDAAARRQAETLLQAVGSVLWVDDETQLDALTALSGSGPAYLFYFIEALTDAGIALGLDDQARRLALETVAGAAQLAVSAGEPPEVLRERVTSKGGTTAAAIARFEEAHLKDIVASALRAARARANEMGDELGRD